MTNEKTGWVKKLLTYKELAVVVTGLIMAALNIWLSYQLSPIKDSIVQNANAIERQSICADNIKENIIDIKNEVKDTNYKVQKIYELHFKVN